MGEGGSVRAPGENERNDTKGPDKREPLFVRYLFKDRWTTEGKGNAEEGKPVAADTNEEESTGRVSDVFPTSGAVSNRWASCRLC